MKFYAFIAVLAFSLVACHSQNAESDRDAFVAAQENAQMQNRLRIQKFVEFNAEGMARFAMKLVKSEDIVKAIQKTLAQETLHFKTILGEIYAAHQYSPILVVDGALPEMISPLVREFSRLEQHGLSQIDVRAWQDAKRDLEAVQQGEIPEFFAFQDEEKAVIVQTIIEENIDISSTTAIKRLVASLVRDAHKLPRLHETVLSKARKLAQNAMQTARLDVLTADLAMQFARAMAFDNRTHLTAAESKRLKSSNDEAGYDQIARDRTRAWFEKLIAVVDAPIRNAQTKTAENSKLNENNALNNAKEDDDNTEIDETADAHETEEAAAEASALAIQQAESVQEIVQAVYPPHPAYLQLMEAQQTYAQLPDWDKVTPSRLRLRATSKTVPALKRRLALEGYYQGDISEEAAKTKDFSLYDESLRDAVRRYHETHQIAYDEAGEISRDFWDSLNTPRSKRLAQIEENLRRWHQTQIIPSHYYIFINVPDFHGEIWRDGVRVYRFPVVVGNAKRGCDPESRTYRYINATPLMHSRMLYLEYNPYWVVPPRIEQEDYIEKINADPNWLKDHGFEYYTKGGYTMLRQLPGENNALGRVKFIFPNPHSTFLHDSPQKRFFKYPIRAFSHGCMRVWEPLELAKRLLEYDGQWRESIPEEIESFQTMRFNFKTRFDIFIDYFTVRVDDEGRVNFLSDPYRYVRYAIDPPSPSALACTPKNRIWIPRKNNIGEDVGADED